MILKFSDGIHQNDNIPRRHQSLLGEFANMKKSGISRRQLFRHLDRTDKAEESFFGEALEEAFPDDPYSVLNQRPQDNTICFTLRKTEKKHLRAREDQFLSLGLHQNTIPCTRVLSKCTSQL